MSATMFLYTDKGSTISVFGMLTWLLNFLQGLVLFFFAQVRLWSSDMAKCNQISKDSGETTTFKWQHGAVFAHIILDYLKLLIILSAILFIRCCLKDAQFGPGKPRW